MKYIRTKDGIYKNASTDNDIVIICKKRKLIVNPKDVIKQADTIEELCDEFVIWTANKKAVELANYECAKEFMKEYVVEIYGAIWTDKGLIYVAKMNDKGELELL